MAKLSLPKDLAPIQRYGLAVVSVAIALGIALILRRYGLREVEFPLFLFALALTAWFAGDRPAILAVVLSSLAFNYFFIEPLYSFYVRSSELPYYLIFILFATLLSWFSSVRRRVERQLMQSHDELESEVSDRRQREEAIRKLNEELGKKTADLESSNKELEAFAYSVSHDLRAPIRHVVGYAQL